MKLYSIAMFAKKQIELTAVHESLILAGATVARNKHEAVGKGMDLSRKVFPPSGGFYSHTCDVFEIPQEMIEKRR